MGRYFGRIVSWEKPPAGKVWRALFDDGHKVYLHEGDVAAIAALGTLPSPPLLVETNLLGRVKNWELAGTRPTAGVPNFGLSERDWATLWMAPLWVLAAVGGADGMVEVEEMDGLFRHMAHADAASSSLGRAVFAKLASDFDECQSQFLADPRSAESGLHDVRDVLDRLDNDDAFSFRAQMITLARDVGLADGAFSAEEKTATLMVAALIGVSLDEF